MKQLVILIFAAGLMSIIPAGCGPSEPQPIRAGLIKEGVYDPDEWGKVYPLEYESWLKTKEAKPSGKSKYRRGSDEGKTIYDKLSEFPYAALLYHGWGFGVEYNEPRGHYYALHELTIVDQSRTKPGGVCLACKSPYHKSFVEKQGLKYLKMKFADALKLIPEKNRELGPACIDCHKSDTMGLVTNKPHIQRGLAMLGKKELTRQEARIMVCAQCHVTYYVPRDREMKVAEDIAQPWTGSSWGDISIENIIKDLLTDFKRIEWVQKVTGFGMPFIRHPEFEMFSRNSVHFKAGLACADCHMPYRRTGAYKISDHDVTSPLKAELRACSPCHTESATWLKGQILAIQDRTASLLSRAGYAAAVTAKLFEKVHAQKGIVLARDRALYDKAKNLYLQAFLRLVFVSAENSTGFHNPSEAGRILGDSIAFSLKSEALLRQALTRAGVEVPEHINLELGKYLNNRGTKKLNFKRDQEYKDPFDIQKNFTPDQSKGY